MTEKKGFFRRVFSFGQKDEPESEAPVTNLPEALRPDESVLQGAAIGEPSGSLGGIFAPVPSLTADDRSQLSDGDALAEPSRPTADEMPDANTPTTLAAPTDTDAVPTAVLADEPAWLDPDAPEPEADFSWLEAGDGETSERNVKDPLAAGIDSVLLDGADGAVDVPIADEPKPAALGDATREPKTEPAIAADPQPTADPVPRPASAEDEPDFSFLDPDAPLPEEEEDEADFSWLEPEGDVAESEADAPTISGAVAAIGAAGNAAASASASPSSSEGGWRLREAAASAPTVPAPRTTFLDRLREGLARSSNQLSGSITSLFTKRRLDDETLQDFEDVLLQADLGVETALRITDRLSEGRFGKEITGDQVRTILADEVEATLRPVALPLELDLEKKPHVILVVGVNGTGKTTTIGKLAAKLTRGGLKVTLCAGDTFRAAAVEQLKIWGERTGSEVVAKSIGADAAGLAFEAYDRAVENDSDVLIIDTAGRLQNKAELMAELEKIVRVLQKREPDAPHTVLQTLDATTGQNALSQVEIFRNVAGVNGLVMTKLDGTARGGILVAIAAKYRLPVYFVGVGEGIDDLEPFKARDFALAIAGKTG